MPFELNDLRESNEFLNLVLENINSAILIADENMRIHQFNQSFLGMFDQAADRVLESSFGQISGCVNAVTENKSCGFTSQCRFCVLRGSLLKTLLEDYPVDGRIVERVFYIGNRPVVKNLEVSSRLIRFQGRPMILVIIYDITQIEEQRKKLEEQQRLIDQELATAASIQKSLLPDTDLGNRHIAMSWKFVPCGHIGGDLFQVEPIGNERLGMYIMDVCGHGVSAALVAVSISQFLTSLHSRMRMTGKWMDPRSVMDRLDKAFPLERFDCFFSIAYVSLDVGTGRLMVSNAGHMPPLLLRASGGLERLETHGTTIGSGFCTLVCQEEIQLYPGDRLFLYTDGLVENFGRDGEREGKERLAAFLTNSRALPLAEQVDQLFESTARERSGSPPSDDMSLIAIEFIGEGGLR